MPKPRCTRVVRPGWAWTRPPFWTRFSLAVHGTQGLRVVDASAMPYVTNGNIYAPVIMLAEKAADLIAGNTPLTPLTEVPWYRHGAGMPLQPTSL